MNWETLDPAILGPALVTGVLVTATHVPLGRRVLERGIIFLDLALAQVAGLGLIAAHGLDWVHGTWQVQAVAVSAALLAALMLDYCERRWPQIQEAIIGSLFVLASSGGILLLASDPHGSEQLKDLLAGQILWVSYPQLVPVAILYALVLGIWFTLGRRGSSLLFYILFALVITASVQLVGVYLVFASLILPALAVRLCKRGGVIWGYGVSAAGYAIGLALSALWDLPAGAAVVCALALTAMAGGWLLHLRANRP